MLADTVWFAASAITPIDTSKKEILKTLEQRMQEAAERLDFEAAALLRDQIAAIRKVSAGQKVVVSEDTNMDVIALPANWLPGRSAARS